MQLGRCSHTSKDFTLHGKYFCTDSEREASGVQPGGGVRQVDRILVEGPSSAVSKTAWAHFTTTAINDKFRSRCGV
jgi:hypothetical protein